jgi:uncharacterized protein
MQSSSTTPDALFEAAAGLRAVISQLVVYPIKSCAGVPVRESLLLETGLEFDRAWMVVDADGHFLTQRELPRMALVQPQLKHFDMILRAPGMLALHVKLDEVEGPVRVSVWNDEVAAFDMGAVAAQWFTDFLGRPARLVRFDPDHKRPSNPKWTGDIEALNQFSDGYPVLVISEASLAQFNEKRVLRGEAPAEMARFRPNIVLASAASADEIAPHDEDRINAMQIVTDEGTAVLKLVKPCPRCPIPNVDPVTAESSPAVGDLLQSYRKNPILDGAVTFGMNAIVISGVENMLKVGQAVSADFRFD